MARSKAFLGIKRDVVRITATIPSGAVTTFSSIGAYMSVIPRQVAYILATLTDDEQRSVPWYRVVGEGGKLGTLKVDALGRSQEVLLLAEGVAIQSGAVADFAARFIDAARLEHEVEPHRHYRDQADGGSSGHTAHGTLSRALDCRIGRLRGSKRWR